MDSGLHIQNTSMVLAALFISPVDLCESETCSLSLSFSLSMSRCGKNAEKDFNIWIHNLEEACFAVILVSVYKYERRPVPKYYDLDTQ